MDIRKQHIVLNLIKSGHYVSDEATGGIISLLNKPKLLQPNRLDSGYYQYNLQLGYGKSIPVYGHAFTYLARHLKTYDPAYVIDHIDKNKSNNRADNLRCITEAENNGANFLANYGRLRDYKPRIRLSVDIRNEIREASKEGVSFVKLAKKYGTTRQTISKVCSETYLT